MHELSIAACNDYTYSECENALKNVIREVDDLSWVQPGMKIAVKANLVSGASPEKAVTTNPILLTCLTKLLRAKGANVIIGDSPGGLYTPEHLRHVYAVSGLRQCEEAGAVLNMDCTTETVSFPGAKSCKSFEITSYLLKADAIIDFCKLKSHGMLGMSGAVKNLFGIIPGTMKPEYHYKYPNTSVFSDMLIDLNEYLRPKLNLVDAVIGMEGNGPTAGTPRKIGAVIAGKSPYQVDLLCARIIGMTVDQLPILTAACNRGLLTNNLELLDIAGNYKQFVISDFQTAGKIHSLLWGDRLPGALGLLESKTVGKMLETKPNPDKALCIGCGKCASICPAKAIQLQKKKPVINRSQCIKCFCCQEFCPVGAMKVHRTLLSRILTK